jgi:uncharacterized protein YbjT (DUF2867 family)
LRAWISTPTQPIALEDVVRCLVGVAGLPEARGQSFDVGGPEVLTYRQMIERIARIVAYEPTPFDEAAGAALGGDGSSQVGRRPASIPPTRDGRAVPDDRTLARWGSTRHARSPGR